MHAEKVYQGVLHMLFLPSVHIYSQHYIFHNWHQSITKFDGSFNISVNQSIFA